ncbi:hypothetical protein N431DRAFT_471436 [Stipitochalara longipes BDJ]|nr:hypothetical protein N431DRAFT_471436 [Stipitochalara longipes BDJ]
MEHGVDEDPSGWDWTSCSRAEEGGEEETDVAFSDDGLSYYLEYISDHLFGEDCSDEDEYEAYQPTISVEEEPQAATEARTKVKKSKRSMPWDEEQISKAQIVILDEEHSMAELVQPHHPIKPLRQPQRRLPVTAQALILSSSVAKELDCEVELNMALNKVLEDDNMDEQHEVPSVEHIPEDSKL